MSKGLMIPNLVGCWTAIHPVAGSNLVDDHMSRQEAVGIIDSYTSNDVARGIKDVLVWEEGAATQSLSIWVMVVWR